MEVYTGILSVVKPGRQIGVLITTPGENHAWECQMFGCGDNIVMQLPENKVPNTLWRWMQFVFFGNKWRKINHADS